MINDRFVCPNDRRLELRSKINLGWSYYTNILSLNRQLNSNISNNLNQKSLTNQEIEHIENVLKRNQYIQYIEQERIRKLIDLCDNCSIQTNFNQNIVSLCNICSENRQLWKKSAAWFFHSLPKPSNATFDINSSLSFQSSQYIKTSDAQSISDQSSSDNDSITDRFNKKLVSNNKNLNQFKQLNDNQDEINKCDDADKRIYSFKNSKLTSTKDSIDAYLSKCELVRSSKNSYIRLSPINEDCGLGRLDFEIVWKKSEYKLIIRLLRLDKLRSNNQNQYSHIYLKLNLLPAIHKSTELESGMIDDTLVYDGISLDDINYKSVKFSVYDKDSSVNHFHGEYRFKLSTIQSDQYQIYSVYLQNKTDCENDEDINERGKILISLMYSNETSNFHVKIKRACYLLPIDIDRKSNPYCQLCLFSFDHLSNKLNFKTDIKKQTLNPQFNQEFIYKNIQLKKLITKTLQITVYDKGFGKKDNFIGN
ncbi:unnamed protein product [Rotaria sordida]|uniref:C2 domain-containing protein n=1 Tax=Rotaria sordida TaxID=392033 RepID=A0A814ZH00_9BILA|nr:unnamed protein product [Rotaria sordida]CAF1524931.1 unnamed protein product [Rotaria sordida]